jgi:hypothetical protein
MSMHGRISNQATYSRTRHFERATVLIKYAVLQLIVAVYLIGTKFMCADIFTKATDELGQSSVLGFMFAYGKATA